MNKVAIPDRAIRLKHREFYTPQGCKVATTHYTSLQGVITEVVVLSTKSHQERRQ